MSVPLVIAGALAVVAGIVLLVARRSGAAWAALGLGAVLVMGAFVFPRVSEEAGELPRLSITDPTDGADVPAGELTVRFQVENAELASSPDDSGGHVHLYLDDTLVQMPYGDNGTVDVSAGPHTLRVEYVDERHISYTPPVEDSIDILVT
ncbi:MAG: hypothetical protein ACRDH8_11415 [Actinomycetota bacterium]